MNKKIVIFLFAFLPNLIFGQNNEQKTSKMGFVAAVDFAYNFPDKVLNPGMSRKWSIGASFTNKAQEFLIIVAVGIKGSKITLYSPTFRNSFLRDVEQNYVPINGYTEDSLIGAKMNSTPGSSLFGSYAQYIHAGFVLNNKFKPSINFYLGNEEFLLFDKKFAQFEDPEHGDIDYVGMSTKFLEVKVGCGFPLKLFEGNPIALNINVGYKWVDYGTISFNKTPLSAYTKGNLADKYRMNNKFTLSLTYIYWTNWDFHKSRD